MYKILFINNDVDYSDVIVNLFELNGFQVDNCLKANEGLQLAKRNSYDMILISLNLESILGTQLLEVIKLEKPKADVIILSDSNDSQYELMALKAGAVDYIKKDCALDILLERVKLAINRESVNEREVLESAQEGIEVDLKKRLVTKNDEIVHLTKTEYDLLVMFLSNKKESISREKIIREIWKVPANKDYVDSKLVNTHIKNLKKKLDIRSIISIRGIGYRWYE
ncbi:MAG: response regulator transcription factor [Erysipelotrichales bacterium]